MKPISIKKDFTEYPGLRHCSISDDSGEEFYHKILNKAFKEALDKGLKLTVDIDNTAGYAPSFLDEAFGNLVYDFGLKTVRGNLIVISTQEPTWIEMIEEQSYGEWEERRVTNNAPKITSDHDPWYRLINNKLELDVWK